MTAATAPHPNDRNGQAPAREAQAEPSQPARYDHPVPRPDQPPWLPVAHAARVRITSRTRAACATGAVQQALATIIEPAWRELVLQSEGMERSLGMTLVHLMWLELLSQTDLARDYAEVTSVLQLPVNFSGILDQHVKLVNLKLKVSAFLLKLEDFRRKHGRPMTGFARPPLSDDERSAAMLPDWSEPSGRSGTQQANGDDQPSWGRLPACQQETATDARNEGQLPAEEESEPLSPVRRPGPTDKNVYEADSVDQRPPADLWDAPRLLAAFRQGYQNPQRQPGREAQPPDPAPGVGKSE